MALQGLQNTGANQVAATQAAAAEYAPGLQQQRFNTVFPWLQGQVSGLQSTLSGKSGSGVGGFGTGGPTITTGPVLNPQQIGQEKSLANAGLQQNLGLTNQTASNTFAGNGFGANSPLEKMLQGTNAQSERGQQVSADTNIDLTSAQNNSQQNLASQTANAGVYAQRQQEGLQARQQNLGLYGQMLGILNGTMG
jgi:hypothetical protein